MVRAAKASGESNANDQNEHETLDASEQWLSDPIQLAAWQEQLVNSCLAINRQLTDIRSELSDSSDGCIEPTMPFRLLKA